MRANLAINLLASVGGLVLWGLALLFFPFLVGPVIGVLAGAMVFLFIAPLIPHAIEPFVIQPNRNKNKADANGRYEMSRQGFFTDLQQGRVKVKITWNGSFVTMLMDYDGRRFEGEDPSNDLRSDQEGYWKVVPSGELPDSHPLPFPALKSTLADLRWWLWVLYSPISIIWWIWTRYVYALTGAVWVGVPGFRTIRIYPLDRFVVRDLDDGTREMHHKKDFSDHYRVAQFQLGVRVPNADTQDMMPVKVDFNEIGQVTNPFLVAFNTDDQWPQRFSSAGANAITTFTRSKLTEDVIAAKNTDGAQEMTTFVTERMTESLADIGIVVKESQYVDVSTADPQDAIRLGDKARARVDMESKQLRAKGDAAPVREIGQALRDYPEAAHIPALDAQVRSVQAAGDRALIFFGNTGNVNPLDAASVRELRQINERLAPPDAP